MLLSHQNVPMVSPRAPPHHKSTNHKKSSHVLSVSIWPTEGIFLLLSCSSPVPLLLLSCSSFTHTLLLSCSTSTFLVILSFIWLLTYFSSTRPMPHTYSSPTVFLLPTCSSSTDILLLSCSQDNITKPLNFCVGRQYTMYNFMI